MRSAVGQANQAYKQAAGTADTFAGEAAQERGNLEPFLTQEMLHPQGFGQQGLSAMTAAAEGGAGGAASGLVGQAEQRAAASRNAGGYQAALDEVARNRMKAAAGQSENIAAQNANLQEQQRQAGAAGLGHLYGVDTSGMLTSQGQEAKDIEAEVAANNSGWLQNAMGIISSLGGGAAGAGSLVKAFKG